MRKECYRIFPGLLGLLLILMQFLPSAFALDDDAYEGYTADTLTVEVGYFGGPYYEKRVFTLDELKTLATVKQDYTFIDNMPSVIIDHVVGVSLEDLMRESGIDSNSIEVFRFWTVDKTTDFYTQFTKKELLDTPRYCYYSLPENFDSEEGIGLEGADAIAEPVPTVIAVEDDWNRCIQGAEFGGDYSGLNASTRYRLIYGQVDTSTRTAQRSARWVHKIEVTLGGTPSITVDTMDLEMEVGSIRRVSAQYHAADSAIADAASIQWSSSDESVATVDQDGNVTMVGEGSAVITASSGSTSKSFAVNSAQKAEEEETQEQPEPDEEITPEETSPAEEETVPEEPESPPEKEVIALGTGQGTSGSSNGNGSGSGNGSSGRGSGERTSSSSSGNAVSRSSRVPSDQKQPAQEQTEPEQQPEPETDEPSEQQATMVQEVTLDGTEPLTVSETEGGLGGVQNWRVYEMSEAAQELPELETENPLMGFTGAASGFLLTAGGVTEYVLYRRRF